MRTCPACSFENMNSAAICGRCGAKLVWDGPTDRDSFRPPRAGRRKILYPMACFCLAKIPRRHGLISALRPLPARRVTAPGPSLSTVPGLMITALRRLPAQRLTAAALSLVPGLGHWYLGEKGEGLRLGALWLAPLGLAFFWYHFIPGLLLIAAPILWVVLMSIHYFAVLAAARPRRYCQSAGEVAVVSFILLGLVLALYLVSGYIIQNFLQIRVMIRA
ncbi:MAG: hypothetical protein LBP33_01055 [Candidatus Adiutrix sp.]|jgi:hypothetical protein|nr:hypothetical protein [Candidatus Adiutrix sp.]